MTIIHDRHIVYRPIEKVHIPQILRRKKSFKHSLVEYFLYLAFQLSIKKGLVGYYYNGTMRSSTGTAGFAIECSTRLII